MYWERSDCVAWSRETSNDNSNNNNRNRRSKSEKYRETLSIGTSHLSCNSDDKPYWVSWIRMGIKWSNNRTFVVPFEKRFPCNWCSFSTCCWFFFLSSQCFTVRFMLFFPSPIKQNHTKKKRNSWAQFDTIPKRTIYQIIDIKLMRMRLAHKWNTSPTKRNSKPTEWSISWCFTIILWFLWTGYYVIGIYSFFLLSFSFSFLFICGFYSSVVVGALSYCAGHTVKMCVSQAIYYRYQCCHVWCMSSTRSGNVRPIMFLLYRITRKLMEFGYKPHYSYFGSFIHSSYYWQSIYHFSPSIYSIYTFTYWPLDFVPKPKTKIKRR